MMRSARGAAYGSVAAVALACAPAPARAQDAATGQPDQPDQGAIIVTARRVQERLQDVPISITVFNQAQINDRNVTTASELATYTPSLSANTRYGGQNASFAIRGFSQEPRTSPSVGVYFADVVAPRGGGTSIPTGDGAGPGSFFDLQNVQILKGPQGTLFGRNTTGGAILLVPQRPTGRVEGYVEGSLGNYDLRRIQAVLNLPLGDRARLRLGFDRQTRDGYLHNIAAAGPADFEDSRYWAARASLVLDLTPGLENYTIVSASRTSTNGPLPQVTQCNPALFPTGVLSCQQIARRVASGDAYAVQSSLASPFVRASQFQIINTTTWAASDALTVKNIAAYSQLRQSLAVDLFGTEWLIPATLSNAAGTVNLATGALAGTRLSFNNTASGPGGTTAHQENIVEELQFQGNALDRRLTWQAGGYMEISEPLGTSRSYSGTTLNCIDRFALNCVSPLLIAGRTGSLTTQTFQTAYRDYGLYAQASFDITEQLKLTGGLRYTWDVSRSVSQSVQYVYSATTRTGLCSNPLVRPRTQPVTDRNQCTLRERQDSDAPTWLVDLDYKPVENLLVYAKWARGYRQGSVSPLSAGGFTTFRPEHVDTYEVGTKGNWHGGLPGYFNGALFYNDFRNQQLAQGFTSSPAAGTAPPNNAIVNIGKSRIQGAEVDAGVGPFHGLRLDGSYAYIDSKLKQVSTPVFPVGSPYDGFIPLVVGKPLPYTPRHKYSVTATYALPFGAAVGEISLGATYTYVGRQYLASTIYGFLPSYDLLNLNVNWRGVAGLPVDLNLFATNVTKTRYRVGSNDQYASSGFASYILGQPRMYGLRLRYRFD